MFRECCALEEIILLTDIEKIGEEAFMCNSLKELRIPYALKEIGTLAFYDCHSLRTVHLEAADCDLTYSGLGETVRVIYVLKGGTVEEYCKNKSLLIFREIEET